MIDALQGGGGTQGWQPEKGRDETIGATKKGGTRGENYSSLDEIYIKSKSE